MLLQICGSASFLAACAYFYMALLFVNIPSFEGFRAKIEEEDLLSNYPKTGRNFRGGPYLSIIDYSISLNRWILQSILSMKSYQK